MIKPDGVQRGIVGEIIKRFEAKGFKLVAMKLTAPGKDHMEQHYIDLKDKKFFPGLISYMTSGPVVAMVWEGKDAVKVSLTLSPPLNDLRYIANIVFETYALAFIKTGRKMLGATMPSESDPGTIRGDLCIEVGRNIVSFSFLPVLEMDCHYHYNDVLIHVRFVCLFVFHFRQCHGSDSVASAEKEIALWFPEGTTSWESCQKTWVYE